MLAVPERISTAYEIGLLEQDIPTIQQNEYKKWLRYYLDFCKKYQFSAGKRTSLPAFIEKLRSKKQTEAQCQQAQLAIELFYDLCEQGRAQQNDEWIIQPQPIEIIQSVSLTTTPDNEFAVEWDPQPQATESQPNAVAEPPSEYKQQGASWVQVYEKLQAEIKLRHYSPKTLSTYQSWLRKFQTFVKSKDSRLLNQQDVKDFLTELAVKRKVAASTQNQAFNALLFLYKQVLEVEFGEIKDVSRAKRKPYVPVVLSRAEIDKVLAYLPAMHVLPVQLLYGCGLRLSECLKLRLQDFNLEAGRVKIHRGKGSKDRTLPLPQSIMNDIHAQFERVTQLHDEDVAAGYAGVFLSDEIEQKYKNAAKELPWQWFFPAKTLTLVAETKEYRRYHLHETHLQKAIRTAVKRAKLTKRVSAHTFRHSFASHLIQAHYDIRTVQELMGHADVKTTMIYLQTVPSLTLKEAQSPLDFVIDK